MHASMLSSCGCYVEASLYHGYDVLNANVPPMMTSVQMGSNSIRCGEWLDLGSKLSNMPRGCSVRFTVHLIDPASMKQLGGAGAAAAALSGRVSGSGGGRGNNESSSSSSSQLQSLPVCWVNFVPFDEDGLLKTGF